MTPTVRSVTAVPFTDAVVCRQNGQDDRGCGNETDAEVQAPSPSAVLPVFPRPALSTSRTSSPSQLVQPAVPVLQRRGGDLCAHLPTPSPRTAAVPGRKSETASRDKSTEGDPAGDGFSRGELSGPFNVSFFRPQPTLKSRLCAGFTTRPRVMEHVSRSGMGWCCPHLSGIPPSLSGIGAERKAKLNRSTPGVLNG